MSDIIGTVLAGTAAICAGVTGGVYFAFSAMVMPSLRTRPASEAIATMRTINEMAVRIPFMTVFFGGAAVAAAVIVTQVVGGEMASFNLARTAGAALAFAGFVATMAFNVPRNDALARNADDDNFRVWQNFDQGWSRANHVRAVLAITGAIALTASLAH